MLKILQAVVNVADAEGSGGMGCSRTAEWERLGALRNTDAWVSAGRPLLLNFAWFAHLGNDLSLSALPKV